jgi:hypothetical protein
MHYIKDGNFIFLSRYVIHMSLSMRYLILIFCDNNFYV